MKTVGVREFRDHATKYLAGEESLEIERHGQTIGYFIPAKRKRREAVQKALDELNETIGQILEQTGMTREEFDDLMDPSKPLPALDDDEVQETGADGHRAASD
jgi:antitoxin (DNA-binding transcriptional repressor) of toxin-antitoxin stability system